MLQVPQVRKIFAFYGRKLTTKDRTKLCPRSRCDGGLLPQIKPNKSQIDRIHLLTNFIEVFKAIQEMKIGQLRVRFVVDILNLFKCFSFIDFRHFSKVLNVVVHSRSIAKLCIKFDLELDLLYCFPN